MNRGGLYFVWLIVSLVLVCPTIAARGQSLDQATADIVWSDDGASLLVATWDTLYVYAVGDWESLPEILPLDTTLVRAIDVLGDLVVAGSDTGVAVFNFRTGERIFYTELVRGHAAFRSEDQIVTGAFGIAVVDIAHPELFQSFGSYYWPVSAFAVSPDGIYAAATNGGEGGYLWEIDTGEQIAWLPDATDFAFSPDGNTLAYIRMEDELYLRDVARNETLWQVIPHEGDGAISVAFHPTGTIIAAAYRDGSLVLCDAETGELIDTIHAYNPVENNVIIDFGLEYAPDGTLLASGGIDGEVRVWDVSEGHFEDEPIATLILE